MPTVWLTFSSRYPTRLTQIFRFIKHGQEFDPKLLYIKEHWLRHQPVKWISISLFHIEPLQGQTIAFTSSLFKRFTVSFIEPLSDYRSSFSSGSLHPHTHLYCRRWLTCIKETLHLTSILLYNLSMQRIGHIQSNHVLMQPLGLKYMD
jgi:hypothetical protein